MPDDSGQARLDGVAVKDKIPPGLSIQYVY